MISAKSLATLATASGVAACPQAGRADPKALTKRAMELWRSVARSAFRHACMAVSILPPNFCVRVARMSQYYTAEPNRRPVAGRVISRRRKPMPQVVICDTNQMPFEEVRRGRVHMIRRKRLPLETGIPGVTMEYSLSIVPDGYFTPRHRHNFDQIRYTLSGLQSTGHGDLAASEVGYFPEGSYYGPQKQEGECACLVLQFQGASGEHLLSNEEMNATYERMRAAGAVFENGIYKGVTADGRRR